MNLHYCDLIADVIWKAIDLQGRFTYDIRLQPDPVKMDLHPDEGYMLTTKKTMKVTDQNGTTYLVTIEQV